jgi:Enoyl-CoA hydratase/isomerase
LPSRRTASRIGSLARRGDVSAPCGVDVQDRNPVAPVADSVVEQLALVELLDKGAGCSALGFFTGTLGTLTKAKSVWRHCGSAMEEILNVTDEQNGVRVFELNRPKVLNALSPALVLRLHEELDRLRDDYDRARVLVIVSAGRAFCSGADLSPQESPVEDSFQASPAVSSRDC